MAIALSGSCVMRMRILAMAIFMVLSGPQASANLVQYNVQFDASIGTPRAGAALMRKSTTWRAGDPQSFTERTGTKSEIQIVFIPARSMSSYESALKSGDNSSVCTRDGCAPFLLAAA